MSWKIRLWWALRLTLVQLVCLLPVVVAILHMMELVSFWYITFSIVFTFIYSIIEINNYAKWYYTNWDEIKKFHKERGIDE